MLQASGLRGDVAFYCSLALQARPPVLELGCGDGRVAFALARAGVRTVGLDLDRAALASAARRSAGVPDAAWIQADMRRPPFLGPFGLILIPYRGFACLLDEDSQRATLVGARELLGPDGRLAFDLFNPEVAELLSRSLAGRSPARPSRRRTVSPDGPALRLVTRSEIEALLLHTGWEIEAVYGGFDGTPLHESATTMVWLARGA